MPYALDEDKLNSADLKMMDIGNPPTRNIPHQEYPRMVYLHPKDKSKEHRTEIVENEDEMDAAEASGFRTAPHVPVPKPQDFSLDYEVAAPAPKPVMLEDMTKVDLIALAKDRDIKVEPQDRKEVIIAAITAAQPA